MFMRISSYKSNPERFDTANAQVHDVRSILSRTKGLVYTAVGHDGEGNAAVLGVWESEEAAAAAEATVAKAWASFGELIFAGESE